MAPDLRAAIYTRVSIEKVEKDTLERQESDCRELARVRGFEVVEIFTDELSAFKRGVVREQYDRMKAGIVEGRFNAILAYRLDRLSRSLSEALKLIELLEDHGAALVFVNGDVDTSGRMGKAFFQISAVFAELEAATTSERLRNANAANAAKGLPPTGGRRCYGFVGKGERQGHLIPEEAEMLRQAAQDISEGFSLRETTRRMNERGSRTTMDNEWSPRSLVKCLKSPRLRGKRTHQPDPGVPAILTDGHFKDGTPWDVVFTEDEHLYLINRINRAGERYRGSSKRKGNQHLLTGLAICGKCGHRLGYGRIKGKGANSPKVYPRYTCQRAPGSLACGNLSVAEDSLDRYVVSHVREFGHNFVELAEDRRRAIEDVIAQDEQDLATCRHSLADLARERYSPNSPITDELYAELQPPLVDRIASLTEKLSRPRAELEALPVGPKWVRGRLSQIPKDVDGREYLRSFLKAVEVMPAEKQGGRFDGSRVVLHWIGGDVTHDEDVAALVDTEDAIWDMPVAFDLAGESSSHRTTD